MRDLNISPSNARKFGIKIAKDGVLRSSGEILAQKDVDMKKIRHIWPEILNYGSDIELCSCFPYYVKISIRKVTQVKISDFRYLLAQKGNTSQ